MTESTYTSSTDELLNDVARVGCIDVGLDGAPVPVTLSVSDNFILSGAEILRKIFVKSESLIIHDIQFRTDRFVYYDTAGGLQVEHDFGRLSAGQVAGVLLALVFNRNTAVVVSPDLQAHEKKSLEKALTRDRVANFACDGGEQEYLIGSPIAIGNLRLRVQCHFSASGLGITVRILRDKIMSLEDTGLPADVIRQITSLVQKKSGLGLVTGATGSGKSTTLASLMEWVRMNCRKHVLTIEDPVEFHYSDTIISSNGREVVSPSLMTQQEVGKDALSFADGLKEALRKKPDIILIGEIRDAETMSTCLEAAQTGHLILSTLHTRGAAKTLSRILDFYHDIGTQKAVSESLAETLLFVLSQGLIPRQDTKGNVLCVEFFACSDTATKSAVAQYYNGKTQLHDLLKRAGNLEWDGTLNTLRRAHLITDDQEAEYSIGLSKDKQPQSQNRKPL